MNQEKESESHAWVLFPAFIAGGAVLGLQVSYSIGGLGSQYNATIVWDDWEVTQWVQPTCEFERQDAFVRRPLSAVFSFSYFLVGLYIIVQTMIDLARSPQFRNLTVLMEREPFWGPVLASGPVALCGVTFLAFASNREFLFVLIHFTWWATLSNFAAYAWSRLFQEARPQSGRCSRCLGGEDLEEDLIQRQVLDGDASDKQGAEKTGLQEALLSLTSVLCVGAAAGLDVLYFILRKEILANRVQDLLVFLLLGSIVLPVYIHWKFQRRKVYVRWWRLCLVAPLGLGAYAMLVGDFSLSLCRDPSSFAQPFAGFEFISALALLFGYIFFRGDRHQAKYFVIVQADHRLDDASGTVAAFFVPEDDPYRASRKRVANAVPAEQSSPSRNNRADSSGSNSSARRRSSAQVQQQVGGPGRTSTIQEVPLVLNPPIAGDRRNTPVQRRPGSITMDGDAAGVLFGTSNRVEGSTSSRTSQGSDGASSRARVQQQQLKPRPPGALNRDNSVEFDTNAARPRSLERRIGPIDPTAADRSSSDRRLSSAVEQLDAPRARVPSLERRLEPRPGSRQERTASSAVAEPVLDASSARSLVTSGRASLVLQQQQQQQSRAASLDRGFLVAGEQGRAPVSNQGRLNGSSTAMNASNRPSSSSFDQYAAAPIVSAVPLQVPGRGSNSSATSFGERPRPPSLTLEQIEMGLGSNGRVVPVAPPRPSDVPVIVARSRTSSAQSFTDSINAAASSSPGPTLSRPTPPVPPPGLIINPPAPAPSSQRAPVGVSGGMPSIPRSAITLQTTGEDGIPVIRSQRPSSTAIARANARNSATAAQQQQMLQQQSLAAAAMPTGKRPSAAPVASPPPPPPVVVVSPPPGLANAPRRTTLEQQTPSAARPSLTLDAGQATMLPMGVPGEERRPAASSFDSTTGGRRPMAGSMDSASGGRSRPVPGRPRRSSVDREENPALRALNAGRSVERERERSGQQLDQRKIALRTPDEAREAGRRLSVSTFDDEPESPLPQSQMSTAERLAALRAERARLEQERAALQQRRNNGSASQQRT